MNVKLYRSAKMLSFVLAASLALGSAAMATDTDSIHEADSAASVVNQQEVPVEVGNTVTGTALGVGTVEALGVNVRENPNTDAAVMTVLAEILQAETPQAETPQAETPVVVMTVTLMKEAVMMAELRQKQLQRPIQVQHK